MLSMQQFIENAVDVEGDGYCGFYDVAGLRFMYVGDHHIICLDF